MDRSNVLSLVISFALGVASSFTAAILFLYYEHTRVGSLLLDILIRHQSRARLLGIQEAIRKGELPHDDVHNLTRAEWALCLLKLTAPSIQKRRSVLETLIQISDLLSVEERAAAYVSVKHNFKVNESPKLENSYLRALAELTE